MRSQIRYTLLGIAIACLGQQALSQKGDPQGLPGRIETYREHNSSALMLSPAVDFRTGDILRIKVVGSAKKIIIRLLPKGEEPGRSVGVVGGPVDVPSGGLLELILPEDRNQVSQISVHGGPNPWDYNLGEGNGAVSIQSASVIRRR